MRLLCRLLGHRWIFPGAIRYEQGKTIAYSRRYEHGQEVNVTWVCDEVCARCGAETWWPA